MNWSGIWSQVHWKKVEGQGRKYNYEEVKEEMTGINEWEGQERIR